MNIRKYLALGTALTLSPVPPGRLRRRLRLRR